MNDIDILLFLLDKSSNVICKHEGKYYYLSEMFYKIKNGEINMEDYPWKPKKPVEKNKNKN